MPTNSFKPYLVSIIPNSACSVCSLNARILKIGIMVLTFIWFRYFSALKNHKAKF